MLSRAPLSRRPSSPRRPPWRPPRPRGRASRRAPAQPRRPPRSARTAPGGKLDRGRVVRRDDHPHPDPRLVEQLLRKAEGHPHAAVRGRIAGQRPAVQRDTVPGDALHVRHPGIVIHVRAVVLVLLDEGEDAGRRLASLDAGRHRRAQDPAVGVVDVTCWDLIDTIAMIGSPASRGAAASVGGAGRACLAAAPAVSAVSAAIAASVTMAGGLQRRIAMVDCAVGIDLPCHARLKCLSALASIKCQIAIFGNRRHISRQFAPGDYPLRRQISHIRPRVQEEGWPTAEPGPKRRLAARRNDTSEVGVKPGMPQRWVNRRA